MNVARKKAAQLITDSPNILVIHSSSLYCIEDSDVLTAAHILDDELDRDASAAVGLLNGLLLMSEWRGAKGRVFFFQLKNARVHLPVPVQQMLENIRDWSAG